MKAFILSLFRGPYAILLGILVLLGACYYVGRWWDKQRAREEQRITPHPMGQVAPPREEVDRTQAPKDRIVSRDELVPLPTAPRPTPLPALPQRPGVTVTVDRGGPAVVSDLVLYEAPAATPHEEPVKETQKRQPQVWLSRGKRIPCRLTGNINSSWSMDVPVFAEVTRNVEQVCDGRLYTIIPAGTLVSCFARPGAKQDRVEVSGTWSFTWLEDGREATCKGVALLRQADLMNRSFGPDDSTAGIPGDLIETDHWRLAKEILLLFCEATLQTAPMAATALLQQRPGLAFQTPDVSGVTTDYLRQEMQAQTGDSRYVHIWAGTEFYVVNESVLFPLERGIGGNNNEAKDGYGPQELPHVPGVPANEFPNPPGLNNVPSAFSALEPPQQGMPQAQRSPQQTVTPWSANVYDPSSRSRY